MRARNRLRRGRRIVLAGAVLVWAGSPAPAPAQTASGYYNLGPRSLYGATEPPALPGTENLPVVMRDAIQNISIGKRLIAVKPRIMGGEPAPIGAYPWVASIGLKGFNQRDGHFCGGAFIAPQWVVTAAHCVNTNTADKIQILGGSSALERGGNTYLVDRVVVDDKYNAGDNNFDVALLHLSTPFKGATVRLLSPAEAEKLSNPGTLAIAAGWGLTAEGTQVSNVLRHVTVQIVSNKVCNGLAAYSGVITDQMLCAGFAEGGKDSCQGDSGGPLMVPDHNGGYYQAGIVSFGEGCGRPNKFGVYTRVSAVYPWIEHEIGGTPMAALPPAQQMASRGAAIEEQGPPIPRAIEPAAEPALPDVAPLRAPAYKPMVKPAYKPAKPARKPALKPERGRAHKPVARPHQPAPLHAERGPAAKHTRAMKPHQAPPRFVTPARKPDAKRKLSRRAHEVRPIARAVRHPAPRMQAASARHQQRTVSAARPKRVHPPHQRVRPAREEARQKPRPKRLAPQPPVEHTANGFGYAFQRPRR